MRVFAAAAAACALAAGLLGCTTHHHHHHPAPKAASLEAEHDAAHIVVRHDRPGPDAVCWKHRRHWHCRRR